MEPNSSVHIFASWLQRKFKNFQLPGETVYSSRESEDGAENRTVERHFGSILIADGSQAINVSAKKDLKRGNIVRFSTLIVKLPSSINNVQFQ